MRLGLDQQIVGRERLEHVSSDMTNELTRRRVKLIVLASSRLEPY